MSKKPYYITTAIAYTSGKPHIGNIYEIVLTDAIARYKREQGFDVFFQTGTDEHGLKIAQKANENGISPQTYVDHYSSVIKDLFELMNISYDNFVRTTDNYHKEQVAKAFKKFVDQKDITKAQYEGWYCISCESFYPESQIEDGKCMVCGNPVHKEKEESYFFKLSNYQKQLEDYIEAHPDFITPESRKNEMVNNFIKPGLTDLAISRTTFDWGIKTFDEKHVVYVWLDALMNYITGLGYDVDGNHGPLFNKYWPADLHVIGKDIVRFHTIYWPIFLMALGVEQPKQIFGHPWLLVGDAKMGKSKGNVIYVDDLTDVFGVDAIRYIMLHEMPFERDGSITYPMIIESINTDLANILGNLVSRTIAMVNKYFDGNVTNPQVSDSIDEELIAKVTSLSQRIKNKMEDLHVANAVDEIIETLRRSNKYIDETLPWVLAKNPQQHDRLATVLYNLLEAIRVCAVSLRPFLPETSEKILNQLNTQQRSYESSQSFGHLESNIKIVEKGDVLFPRFNVEETLEILNGPVVKLDHKDMISIDNFDKLELRKGVVLECKQHPKADKLLVFKVDLGDQQVQIVSGIAESYKPDELLHKGVLVLVNLKPIKLRGELSQGMILSTSTEEGFKVVEINSGKAGDEIK